MHGSFLLVLFYLCSIGRPGIRGISLEFRKIICYYMYSYYKTNENLETGLYSFSLFWVIFHVNELFEGNYYANKGVTNHL